MSPRLSSSLVLSACIYLFASLALGQVTNLPSIQGAHGGPILLGVSPYKLVMGNDAAASIEAVLPAGTTDLSFFAAYGRLEDIERLSDTRLTARYVAPNSYIPTVDVVAVAANINGQKHWSYCTVLLYGQGEAKLQTKRGAEAIITIGDRVFGPVEADKFGYASIHVEVPPGMQYGYDAFGRPVDLHIPKRARTAIFVENTEVQMDLNQDVSLYAVVVNPDGSIDESSIPTIIADRGLVKEVRHVGRGAFKIRFSPLIAGEGIVRIESFVPMDESPPSSVRLNLVHGSKRTSPPILNVTPQQEQTHPILPDRPKVPIYWTTKLGYAWEPPSASAFHVDTDIGALFSIGHRHYFAGVSIGFSTSETEQEMDSSTATMTTWVFPIAVEVGVRNVINARTSLLLLGQVGFVHVVTSTGIAVPEGGNILNETSGNQGLVGVGTALEWKTGPGNILGGVRYVWFPGSLDSFNGIFSSLYLDLGYRFWFN